MNHGFGSCSYVCFLHVDDKPASSWTYEHDYDGPILQRRVARAQLYVKIRALEGNAS